MQPATVIRYFSQLTDASLAVIGETCKGLTAIDMSGNDAITDVGIANLTLECREIKAISIAGCDLLTDASLEEECDRCRYSKYDPGMQGD